MAISDLLYKIALARGGVGQESALDKLNKTFQTIGGIGSQLQQNRKLQEESAINELNKKKLEAEIAKQTAEAELQKPALPSYVRPVGSVLKEREFGEEMVPSAESVQTSPDSLPSPSMRKRVFVKSEPIMQTEQSMEEEYNKLPVSKTIPYSDMKQLSRGKIEEIIKERLTQRVTSKNPLQNESALRTGTYGIDTLQRFFPSYARDPKRLSELTIAEVNAREKEIQAQQGQSNRDFTNESNMRKEFIDRPEVKEFKMMSTNVKSMDSLLNRALKGDQKNKVALDQALISMYNKLTDPQSVVRESEYARTGENIPVVNQIQGAITKLSRGGAGITDDDRKALVLGAKIIANERGEAFNATRNEYEILSQSYGIPSERIVGTIRPFEKFDIRPVEIEANTIEGLTPEESEEYRRLDSKYGGQK